VGTDAQGREVAGPALFRRVGATLPPDQLARRAMDILLHQEGEAWLMPGAVPRGVQVLTGQEVAAPEATAGRLRFWVRWGQASPQAARVDVDLATGEARLDGEAMPTWAPPRGSGRAAPSR
jgi:hypothetical protein